ncbi:MAG: IS110 family transposase [Pseudonocardia sp.]
MLSTHPSDGDRLTAHTEETAITSIAHTPPARTITIGVDTHNDTHVAVALDDRGARLGDLHSPATTTGYAHLHTWATRWGPSTVFGIEGTGSYGAGLTRFLHTAGHPVIEVNRPDRATRRRRGKNDTIDAESAARAVLAATATTTPKTGDAEVEMIRMLKTARNSAVKARTQAINQIRALLVTAPAPVRESMTALSTAALLTRCAGLRAAALHDPTTAARHTLGLLARRALALQSESDTLRTQITRLAATAAPALLEVFGIGPDSAATFLIAAGDNPDRIHSEAALAALFGASPVPASSGKTIRYRLNRGGDRQANAALHRVIVVRLRWHQPTRDYMTRRTTEGKTRAEIMRCLKRHLVREIYRALPRPATDLPHAA